MTLPSTSVVVVRIIITMASSSSSVEQLSEGLQHNPVVNSEKDSDAIITRDGNPSIIINVPSSKSSAMESQEAMDNYKNNPKRPVFDRQRSMQGSSAGAGSDFFGKYQKHRTIELERLRKMDEDWDKMQKDLEYHPEVILFKRMEQTQNIQKIAVFRGGTGLNSAKDEDKGGLTDPVCRAVNGLALGSDFAAAGRDQVREAVPPRSKEVLPEVSSQGSESELLTAFALAEWESINGTLNEPSGESPEIVPEGRGQETQWTTYAVNESNDYAFALLRALAGKSVDELRGLDGENSSGTFVRAVRDLVGPGPKVASLPVQQQVMSSNLGTLHCVACLTEIVFGVDH
ncbi:hypothetical protein FOZ60_013768 [Perkinsus olseni]|uniref:Uncharacterized protein n=1 Tax=Perkinsus olseni TaxID=32597 RepID=A0A7J6N954_PEROL|nr:hypothetical protein FOZ60_013768 [Perkinsus olseni]